MVSLAVRAFARKIAGALPAAARVSLMIFNCKLVRSSITSILAASQPVSAFAADAAHSVKAFMFLLVMSVADFRFRRMLRSPRTTASRTQWMSQKSRARPTWRGSQSKLSSCAMSYCAPARPIPTCMFVTFNKDSAKFLPSVQNSSGCISAPIPMGAVSMFGGTSQSKSRECEKTSSKYPQTAPSRSSCALLRPRVMPRVEHESISSYDIFSGVACPSPPPILPLVPEEAAATSHGCRSGGESKGSAPSVAVLDTNWPAASV
mmetsp:Transcript_4589/g.11325  ORF Transcript_4589/g.11325 Transcript_4589/m.11325 type:complete len:262 (-) Transcript_4589:2912-3697(-)